MTTQQNALGTPKWNHAHGMVVEMMELPAEAPEAEITVRLYMMLRSLFPGLRYPQVAIERSSGNGPMDVYCLRVISEAKGKGKRHTTHKRDGKDETPEEQLLRYFEGSRTTNTGIGQRHLFPDTIAGWRGVITDGIKWDFYEFDHENRRLVAVKKLSLGYPGDVECLLQYLYDFVNRPMVYGDQPAPVMQQPFNHANPAPAKEATTPSKCSMPSTWS